MHLRLEPRFTTETDVLLQRLPADTPRLPARIDDVSSAGFRISVQEPLAVGEPLRIIIGEDYKVLVMVRYSLPVEKGHRVGLERMDAWLPDDKGVPTERRDAVPVGRPQLGGRLGLLRTIALDDPFAKKTAVKGRKRPFLAGPPSAWEP